MKAKAKLNNRDADQTDICSITGLPIFQRPGWADRGIGEDFHSAYFLLGDRILVNRARGYARFPDVVNVLNFTQDLTKNHISGDRSYVQIVDCSHLTGASFAARHRYLSEMMTRDRLAAFIICSFDLAFLVFFGLARRHRMVRERVFLALDYNEAARLATEISVTLDNGGDISKIACRPVRASEAIQKARHIHPDSDPYKDQLLHHLVECVWWRKERHYSSPAVKDLGPIYANDSIFQAIALIREELEDLIYESGRAISRLKRREGDLEVKTSMLSDANTTLKILLHKGAEERKNLEEKVLFNVKELIRPYLQKLRKTDLSEQQDTYMSILEANLADIISPLTRKLAFEYSYLTPSEIQVANFVKKGLKTRQIAALMGLSTRTVDTYRDSIRSKLGLKHMKVNLRSYLMSFE
jgi:DNA-binding CsgD family transcriptional regulator